MTDADLLAARAQPADARAGDVGAVHAQPQAQAPAAPHRPPDTAHPRRAGRADLEGLRRRLCRPHPRREARHHRWRRPLAADRAAAAVRRRASSGSRPRNRRTIHEDLALQRDRLSVPAAGPSEYESVRVDLPNRYYDPEKGAALFDRFIEEWQVAEEEGIEIMLNEHHQTPTCVDPAGPAAAGGAGARDQQGAAPDPRQSGRQPPPAGARRRGDGVRRHPVARPHRGRLRARRAVRAFARQLQPGLHQRAPVGGDRPHPQGLHHARRPVQPRGPLLPRAARQHLAAAVPAAASAGLGVSRPAPTARPASARAASSRRPSSPATARPSRCSRAIAAAGARPGAARTCRSTGSPTRRSPTAPTPRRGAQAGAEELLWHIAHQQDPDALRQPAGLQHARSAAKGARVGLARYPKAPTVDAAVEQRHHVRRHARSGAQAVREILRPRRRLRASVWSPASRASSATRTPCTASRCWRARCSPS